MSHARSMLRLEATRDDLSVSIVLPCHMLPMMLHDVTIKFHGEPWCSSNCDEACEFQLLLQFDMSPSDIRKELQ